MKLLRNFALMTFTFMLLANCSSSDNSPVDPEIINLEEAQLTDFRFEEADYLNIEITQPLIEDNEEIKAGEISITLPHTVTSLSLSLKSVTIDEDKFEMFPPVGVKELFSESEFVTYTITSKSDVEKKLRYNVKVIIAPIPMEEAGKLAITDFELLANDNTTFTAIDFKKEATSQVVDSLLFGLFPKTVDFSDLTPVVKYQGSKIEYRINDEAFKEYPVETGKSINFKYPNTVDFKISDATTSTIYRIVLDTERPVVFEETVIIPDLKLGDTYNGLGIMTWTNNGNYPISGMSPNEYVNLITPAAGLRNIFVATLTKNGGGNINPGENGLVNVLVTNTPLVGQYEATAIFNLNFNENSWEIVNTPTDNFISDVGYRNIEMKIKGMLIN